jgi:phosphoglucosamine mutase
VVISASHNPYQDNGIKFFSRDGFKLPDEAEVKIERLVLADDGGDDAPEEFHALRPTANRIGKAKRINDAVGRYVVFLKALFPRDLTLDGLTVVVDCAHGAAYKVAPAVFEELGAKVVTLNARPDGKNINDGCGAVHPESMAKAIEKHGAQLGLALDGDADREVGGRLVRTQVGDRYVVEEMRRSGYNFGGEQSGHLIFLDHVTTGDGVCAALNLLAVMLREGRPLSELARVFEPVPQVQLNLAVKEKRPLEELADVQRAVASVEKALGADGRVLVRYSGTENKARVLVEGLDAKEIAAHADSIATALKKALGG